ncbi:MAG: hypothetical protein PF692_08540 [Kiritimatiellae bacterium]|nr:hypothetical protein [Kiritimatiellia bacterium]
MWSIENSKTHETKKYRVDFFVNIKNNSINTYRFYEPWNSWGYNNLKMVLSDGINEYQISKYDGIWYRNFESFFYIQTNQRYAIPVALSPDIWNMTKVKNREKVQWIRVVYNQICYKPLHDYDKNIKIWKGIQTSQYYYVTNVLCASALSNLWYSTINTNEIKAIENMAVWEYPIQMKHTTNEYFNNDIDIEIKLNIE